MSRRNGSFAVWKGALREGDGAEPLQDGGSEGVPIGAPLRESCQERGPAGGVKLDVDVGAVPDRPRRRSEAVDPVLATVLAGHQPRYPEHAQVVAHVGASAAQQRAQPAVGERTEEREGDEDLDPGEGRGLDEMAVPGLREGIAELNERRRRSHVWCSQRPSSLVARGRLPQNDEACEPRF